MKRLEGAWTESRKSLINIYTTKNISRKKFKEEKGRKLAVPPGTVWEPGYNLVHFILVFFRLWLHKLSFLCQEKKENSMEINDVLYERLLSLWNLFTLRFRGKQLCFASHLDAKSLTRFCFSMLIGLTRYLVLVTTPPPSLPRTFNLLLFDDDKQVSFAFILLLHVIHF